MSYHDAVSLIKRTCGDHSHVRVLSLGSGRDVEKVHFDLFALGYGCRCDGSCKCMPGRLLDPDRPRVARDARRCSHAIEWCVRNGAGEDAIRLAAFLHGVPEQAAFAEFDRLSLQPVGEA